MPKASASQHDSQQRSTAAVPVRFSLRTLLRVTTALAVICGLGTVLPASASQVILGAIWIAISGWLITGIVFAKGDARAFCIGAAVVATSMWTGVGGRFAGGISSYLRGIPLDWGVSSFGDVQVLETWLIHIVLVATAVGNGYLCILARRYFERESP
jgi:hypothetical protein